MVEIEDLFEGIEFIDLHQVPVELLQGIMDPRAHEGLDAFRFGLDLVDIGKLILMGTGFIGGKLGVGIGRHCLPFLRAVRFSGKHIFLTRKTPPVKIEGFSGSAQFLVRTLRVFLSSCKMCKMYRYYGMN